MDCTAANKKLVDGDFDVFGDGTVRILKAPGHTPGSNALLVKLSEAGPIETIVRLQHARVVVQHAPEDFARLPKAPRYLE